jgi:DNA gyrase subunit B
MSPSEYSSEDIEIYQGVDHIRLRPAMYIGDTGTEGLHYLVEQLCRDVFAEFEIASAPGFLVELLADGGICVQTDDPSRPLDALPLLQQSPIIVRTGAIHPPRERRRPLFPAGLVGVGFPALVALSEFFVAECFLEGQSVLVETRRGRVVRPTPAPPRTGAPRGITFRPDSSIFSEIPFSFDRIAAWLNIQAAVVPALVVRLIDSRSSPAQSIDIHHPTGVVELLQERITGPVLHSLPCSAQAEDGPVRIDVAVQWTQTYQRRIWSFVNGQETTRGTHVRGVTDAVIASLLPRATSSGKTIARRLQATGEDAYAGVCAAVSVWHPEPWFAGPTRDNLANPEVAEFVQRILSDTVTVFLDSHPTEAAAIIEHVEEARIRRLADPFTGIIRDKPKRQRR